MISAEVICDSISQQGKRLTTFKLRYPKFIHGEFMTHRVVSRNASSSRAIPTSKLLEEVRSDALRAAPVWWGKNQPGMQAHEELNNERRSTGSITKWDWDQNHPELRAEDHPDYDIGSGVIVYTSDLREAQKCWGYAAHQAATMAEEIMRIGVHKQIVNRLLEPFSHINVVATATEWGNFFGLRLHKDAQPEMRALAITMWEARKASTPKLLKPGEWHLPFVGDELVAQDYPEPLRKDDTAIKVSVARCARVSYESFETGKRSTVTEDLALYERLLKALSDPTQPLHASPAEHQATPDEYRVNYGDEDFAAGWQHQNQWGNFQQWRQYRKMLPGESCAPLPEEFR